MKKLVYFIQMPLAIVLFVMHLVKYGKQAVRMAWNETMEDERSAWRAANKK